MPIRRLQRPGPSEYNPRFDPEITLVPDADDWTVRNHERHHVALFREGYLPHTSLASHVKA